jgi:hypothetical protein
MKSLLHTHIDTRSWFRTLSVSGLLLLVGGLIYIYLRPAEARFIQWFPRIMSGKGLAEHSDLFSLVSGKFASKFIFSLPSGLWAMAYAAIIFRTWYGQSSPARFVWYFSIPVLAFGVEIFQLLGILPGTFCPWDLIAGLVGLTLGALISLRFMRN